MQPMTRGDVHATAITEQKTIDKKIRKKER